MRNSGLVEFGAHTYNHAILGRLNSDEQAREINECKVAIETMVGRSSDHFTYPNNSTQDHDPVTADLISKAGFVSWVNMGPETNLPDTERMHLFRYGIGSDTTFSQFKLMVHHIR